MDDRSSARFEMFVRTLNFGRANAADLSPESTAHVDNLGRIIAELGKAKVGQTGGSAAAKEVLLDALRLDVRNITRTASAVGQDDPGFEKLFRRPSQPNPATLLTTADAIIANLAENPGDDTETRTIKNDRRTRFINLGLPVEFVQSLIDDRAAIDTASAAEIQGDSEGVKNTALVGKLIAEGMKECQYLNAIYHNLYTRQPEKLRAWKSASHIERAAKPAKNEEPAVPESQLTPEPSKAATPATK